MIQNPGGDMRRSFALIKYLDDNDSLKFKYKIIKNRADTMLDWYIKKYNPFGAETIEIDGCAGYLITLPFSGKKFLADRPAFMETYEKTLASLAGMGVEIILPPAEIDCPASDIKIATGSFLSAFFMTAALIPKFYAV